MKKKMPIRIRRRYSILSFSESHTLESLYDAINKLTDEELKQIIKKLLLRIEEIGLSQLNLKSVDKYVRDYYAEDESLINEVQYRFVYVTKNRDKQQKIFIHVTEKGEIVNKVTFKIK